MNFMELAMLPVLLLILAIVLMVFGIILPNLNKSAIGSQSYNLLEQGPIIVTGISILFIVVVGFSYLTSQR